MATKKLKKTAGKKRKSAKTVKVSVDTKVAEALLKPLIEVLDVIADLCEKDGDFDTAKVIDEVTMKLADRNYQINPI